MLQRKTKIELERKKSPDTPFRTMHFCTATRTHPPNPHNQSKKKCCPAFRARTTYLRAAAAGKKGLFVRTIGTTSEGREKRKVIEDSLQRKRTEGGIERGKSSGANLQSIRQQQASLDRDRHLATAISPPPPPSFPYSLAKEDRHPTTAISLPTKRDLFLL